MSTRSESTPPTLQVPTESAGALAKDGGSQSRSESAGALLGEAEALRRESRYVRALPKLSEALEVCRQVFGDKHAFFAAARFGIGYVYMKRGMNDLALAKLEEALSIQRQGEVTHLEVAKTLDVIATVHHSFGAYTLALESLEEALRIRRTVLGDDHPSLAVALRNIAHLSEEALESYQESLRIDKMRLGPDDTVVAGTLSNISAVHQKMGKWSEALCGLEESLRIRSKKLGGLHPAVANTYVKMAFAHLDIGEEREALKHLLLARKILCQAVGDKSVEMADVNMSLALVYLGQGYSKEARGLFEAAYAGFALALGPDHCKAQAAIRMARREAGP